MNAHDLTATSFLTTRLSMFVMCAIGVFFLVQSDTLGWSVIADAMGGENRLFGFGLFCAFVMLALLANEKNALRVRTAELMDGMHQLLYGKNYERDREAIDILLAALESEDGERKAAAHKHLTRLTGQHFGPDARVWSAWWTANRRHFAASEVTPLPEAPAGGGESSEGEKGDGEAAD